MLDTKVEKALNDQINAELYSAYLYLAMAAYFESTDMGGMAHWMKIQAKEELTHANKIYDYVFDRHGRVLLGAVKEPPAEWTSALSAFEGALEHERLVTSLIGKIVDLTINSGDHSTNNFLQWFVAEQVEEESTAAAIVGQLKIIGNSSGGLYMLDRELGARVLPEGLGAPGA